MKTLCPPLSVVRKELLDNTAKLEALARSLDEARWSGRSPHGGWSPAQCAMHLNTTTEAFLPLIADALDRAKEFCDCSSRIPRFDPVGWLMLKSIEPPYRMRMKTPPPFEPGAAAARDDVFQRWNEMQSALIALLERADAYPIGRIKADSPFSARMRYSVFSAFRIIAAHQRRHLWQAERNAAA
jgi:hypothetical protein